MLSNFFPLLCTLLPLSLPLYLPSLLCCVRGQRVERMPRTLGLCDWKHIVSHFNIYDKMPVALCHSLGLYLTPHWQICQEFFQSLCPCHSTLLFLIAFSIWGVQRASSILEHTKILRNAIDVLRPTPRGIFPLNFLLVSLCFFLCFCFLISFGICALVSPLCIDFWAHQPHYINRKYRSWVPTYDEHIGKLNQTVNRLVVLLVMMVPPFANLPPSYPFWLFFLGCHKMSIICRLFALSSRYVCTVSPLPSTCLMSMGNKQWESGEKMPSHLVSVLPINSCLSSRINISILFCFRLIDVVLEYYRQMCLETIEYDIIMP